MQEEDFSSQNVNPVVSSVKESPNGYRYLLSNGASFFVHISRKPEINLNPDDTVPDDLLRLLEEINQFSQAIIQAVIYLNLRDHSEKELELKLRKKNYSIKVIEDVCCSLAERGLINDENFAENFVISRIRKGRYSRNEIIVQLQTKGINRDVISSVLDEYYTEEENDKALNYHIEKLSRKKNTTNEKITASLQRKGFRYTDIAEALADIHK